MLKTLLLLIFTLNFGACKKTIPESQIKSLSGKNYDALRNGKFDDGDMSVFKDFLVGQGLLIDEYVAVSGGMIFTLLNGDNPYGQELFFYDESTRKWSILADIDTRPYEGAQPLGLKIFGGYLYFTASSEDYGREIYSMNLSNWAWSRITDINSGPEDSIFTHYRNNDPYVDFEVIDDGGGYPLIYTFGSNDNGSGVNSHLLKYDVKLSTATFLTASGGGTVTGINRALNVAGTIFAFAGNDIYQVDTNGDLASHGNKANSKDFVSDGVNIFFEATGLIYKVNIGAATSASIGTSGVQELIIFNGDLYAVVNGELKRVDTSTGAFTNFTIDTGTTTDSKVRNLAVANNKLCFTALNDTDNGDGRFLFCSKSTSITGKNDFNSYDFDVGSGSESKVGKLVPNGTHLLVSATNSSGSSVFKMSPGPTSLGTPVALMPYRSKLYGLYPQNYGVVMSFGNTMIVRDDFEWFGSFHGSLTGIATEMRYAFEDNNGVPTNGSSYAIPKFVIGNKVIGNYLGNLNSFWVLNKDNKVVTEFQFGTIKSEPIEHNGKLYFVTQFRMILEIVEYDPVQNTGRHLHPCGQLPDGLGGYYVNICFPGNESFKTEIKLHEIVGDYLFYTATKTDPLDNNMPDGYHLWSVNLSAATPLANEFDEALSLLEIDGLDYYGVFGTKVFYKEASVIFNDNFSNPTLPGGTNISEDLTQTYSKDGFMIYVDKTNLEVGYYILSPFDGSATTFSPASLSILNMDIIDNEVYITSDSAIEKIDFSGASPTLTTVLSFTGKKVTLVDGKYYLADGSGGVQVYSPSGTILRSFVNVLTDDGGSFNCDELDLKIYDEGEAAISFYCDDLTSGKMGPAVYSKKNQKTYLLSEYGIQFTSAKDKLRNVNLSNDNLAIYTMEHSCHIGGGCGNDSEHELDYGKLIEIDDNSGLVNFAAIDYKYRKVIKLKPGVFYSCYDDQSQFFNYNLTPVDKFQVPDSYCMGDEDAAIVDGDKLYFSLLKGFSSNEVGLELYQVQF